MASASTHNGVPLLFRYPGAKGRAIMAYGAAYKAQAAGVKHLIVPFAGSLAEPLWLLAEGALQDDVTLDVNDANPHVANLWRAVTTDGALLAELTRDLVCEWNEMPIDRDTRVAAFKALRGQVNQTTFSAAPTAGLYGSTLQAARFLLFQATGYNGLFRVNSAGKINTPYGTEKDKTPRQLNVEAHVQSIQAAVRLLDRCSVRVTCKDWRDTLVFDPGRAAEDTLVIADPPYHGTFSTYTADGFADTDHIELVQTLADAPCRAIVTNSPSARSLFDDRWDVSDHEVRRSIAPTAKGRGDAGEILAVKRVG